MAIGACGHKGALDLHGQLVGHIAEWLQFLHVLANALHVSGKDAKYVECVLVCVCVWKTVGKIFSLAEIACTPQCSLVLMLLLLFRRKIIKIVD